MWKAGEVLPYKCHERKRSQNSIIGHITCEVACVVGQIPCKILNDRRKITLEMIEARVILSNLDNNNNA